MKQFLSDRRGEGYVSSAVKIIIAIVIGALLLGGLYLLFRPDDGIVTKNMKDGVDSMINFTPELRMKTMQDTSDGVVYLAFSYDGNYWSRSFVPDYGENATVTKVIENGSEETPIIAALIQDGTTYYVVTSTDGGIHFAEQVTFKATEITHCYFGTSASLPSTSGSFSGEKFVIRYRNGSFYTMVSDGVTWKIPIWSDLIPIG